MSFFNTPPRITYVCLMIDHTLCSALRFDTCARAQLHTPVCDAMRLRDILSGGVDGGGGKARVEEERVEEVSRGGVRVERGGDSYDGVRHLSGGVRGR